MIRGCRGGLSLDGCLGLVLGEIGRADPGEVFPALVAFGHFLNDRDQPLNGVSHFLGWSKPHFLFNFDL